MIATLVNWPLISHQTHGVPGIVVNILLSPDPDISAKTISANAIVIGLFGPGEKRTLPEVHCNLKRVSLGAVTAPVGAPHANTPHFADMVFADMYQTWENRGGFCGKFGLGYP